MNAFFVSMIQSMNFLQFILVDFHFILRYIEIFRSTEQQMMKSIMQNSRNSYGGGGGGGGGRGPMNNGNFNSNGNNRMHPYDRNGRGNNSRGRNQTMRNDFRRGRLSEIVNDQFIVC